MFIFGDEMQEEELIKLYTLFEKLMDVKRGYFEELGGVYKNLAVYKK